MQFGDGVEHDHRHAGDDDQYQADVEPFSGWRFRAENDLEELALQWR